MSKPVVAIVVRPNVGKSTLFNRLAERRMAIVDDIPGTTRDRLATEVEWTGTVFDIIDTGGLDPTQVGPGKGQEPLSIGSHQFIDQIRTQAEIAIQEADAILFVVDGQAGVTPADREITDSLRKAQEVHDGEPYPPVLLVVKTVQHRKACREETLYVVVYQVFVDFQSARFNARRGRLPRRVSQISRHRHLACPQIRHDSGWHLRTCRLKGPLQIANLIHFRQQHFQGREIEISLQQGGHWPKALVGLFQ